MLKSAMVAALSIMAGAAGAQAGLKPFDPAAAEALLREAGHLPLRGLAPPDPLVARITWQQMPMAGVPAERRPMREAIRAERLGEFDTARAAWAAVAADPKSGPTERDEALLAAVRLGVTQDAAAARAALAAVQPALRQSVGVRMLEARLLLMEGKRSEAVALLSGEMAAAMRLGRVPATQLMVELSVAASIAGDHAFADQMAGWGQPGLPSGQLRLAIPRCAPEDGLLADDRAVVDIGMDLLGQINRATPVWASRAGPMAERLAARALDGVGNPASMDLQSGTPLRLLVQLSCAPHDIVPNRALGGAAFVELGSDGIPRPNAAVRKLILATRQLSPEQALSQLEDTALPADLHVLMLSLLAADMGERPDSCGAVERVAGAEGRLTFNSGIMLAVALEGCKSPEAAARQLQKLVDDEKLPAADRRAAAGRAAALTRDPALRARMAAAALLPPDSCLLLDDQQLKGLVVGEEDFPQGLRKQSVDGHVKVTFDRSANGETSALRSLLGQPPLLFDEANRALLQRHRPLPPQRDGRAVACKGHVANIRWQLQDTDDGD